MELKQKTGYVIIGTARKLFAGTTVQTWPITTTIYQAVFRGMYGKKDVKTKFRGLNFIIPTNDITLAPSILSGSFEEKELEIFENLCQKDQVILDVGANIGLYSALAAHKVGAKGKVYAFEPIDENLKYLKQNLKANKLEKRVEIVEQAVGEKPGNLEIFMQEGQIGTHSAVHSDSGSSVKVPMCSIDSFVKKNKLSKVDVIKIDVEGYDGNVLSGALQTLKKFKPILFIEYSPSLLTKSGFTPKNFRDSLFGIYQNCYLVDEFKGKVYQVNEKSLKGVKIATNVNLVLSDEEKHLGKINGAITISDINQYGVGAS